jgi:chemotaxis protein MotB
MSSIDGQMDEKRGGGTPSKEGTGWMVTFTDLISLMLTFFVLVFSMSTIDIVRWNEIINSLSQSLAPTAKKVKPSTTASFKNATLFRKQATNLDYLTSVLNEVLAKDELLASSKLMRLEDRLIIALPNDFFFQPGKAVLPKKAKKALFNLGGVLSNIGNKIGINGHTDPAPPTGNDYTSNWELSIGRATAVANALTRAGYAEEIVAFGYADSRFDELPDMPAAERRVLGSRVDVVVLPTVAELK